jgi:tetratricopeptide (TPR) repeat protein
MKTCFFAWSLVLISPSSLQAADWLELLSQAREAQQSGKLDAALMLADEALHEAQSQYGKEAVQVSSALNELALIENERGNQQQAQALISRAVAIASKVQGDSHASTLIMQLNLGLIAQAAQDHEQAVAALQAYVNKRPDGEDEALLRALRAVSYSKLSLKDYSGAEQSARAALAIYSQRQADPQQQAICLDFLAAALRGQQRLQEALLPQQQAVQLQRKISGDNKDIAERLIRLADQNAALGHTDEAQALQSEALSILEKVEPEGELIGLQLYLQALEHHRRKEYQQAEPLYQRSLDILRKHAKEHSQEAAVLLVSLAELKSARKEREAALELFQQALAIHAADPSLPQQHAQALFGRGRLYLHSNRLEKAEVDLLKSLQLLEGAYGQNDPILLPLLEVLAAVSRKLDKAEPSQESAGA